MRKTSIVFFLALISGSTSLLGANWGKNLDKLITSSSAEEQEQLITKIVRAQPSWEEVYESLRSITFAEVATDSIYLHKTVTIDGVERSWLLYVPPTYDPARPTPLFVNLHGGISRLEPIPDSEAVEYMEDNFFRNLAERQGWLLFFPLGQAGAVWWDSVGMGNINNLVRTVKKDFNVDDDRVWMGGYSDGASGAFAYGMVNPTDYAAFLALSGHIGVGSLDGGLYTYAPNLTNTPTYAVTSFEDELYPSHRMRPTIQMALDAGGDVYYREQEGHHDFSYADEEADLIVSFLDRHPRDPFTPRLVWETADSVFGLCRWFAIDEVDTAADPAAWHVDYNATLTDERVTIGFNIAEHDGDGVLVGMVYEGTAADSMGLVEGNVIVGAEDFEIAAAGDIGAYKATKQRGDSLQLSVIRGDEELDLRGKFPDVAEYQVFDHDVPSARADVSFLANRIDVEGSRVDAFRLLVHPDMIRLERPLIVTYNGEEVYNQTVEPDIEFMLRSFLANRDRKLIYVAEVSIDL